MQDILKALLPYEQMIFTTKLNLDEVLNRLYEATEPYQFLRIGFTASEKPYEGYVKPNKFSVLRIIRYRNSFNPRIVGTILPKDNGTEIHVNMRLRYYPIIFIAIWLFFNVTFFLASFSPIPFLLILFIYLITLLGFKYESAKSRRFFAALFEADIQRLL